MIENIPTTPGQRETRLGLCTIGILAVILALLLSFEYPPETLITGRTAIALAAFALIGVLAEGYPLKLPFGNAALSLSGTIFWTLLVLFEPMWAASCAFLSLLVSELAILRKGLIKGVFNAGQTALSVLLGAFCFNFVNGSIGLNTSPEFFVAFALGAFTYWLTNTSLVSIGAFALYGEAPHRFWQKNFQWTLFYELTTGPIALVVAYAYQQLWLIGLLLVALPILMIRLTFSQYVELKKTYRETVRTLVKIIEMHDPYTAGHSDRVATYSRHLCEALRLSAGKIEKIELAAFLHDLGKIHLDLSGIVKKAGKLTDEEKRLVRLHSVVSADLANQVSYFKGEIEMMIRHHHENFNGTGYPHGLKGHDIPLGSRIILIADAFDAMTTSRVYRDALDLEKVKNEFRKFSGTQFDPALVPIFLDKCVGDGSQMVPQQVVEPLEGQRARSGELVPRSVEIHSIQRQVIG